MAEIQWVRTSAPGRTTHYVWASLTNGDTGLPLSVPGAADMSFQVYGTFSTGGTIVLQGSLDVLAASATYFTMKDGGDNLISFTSADGEAVAPLAAYIRPNVTGGDGSTSLTAILFVRSTMK